METTNKKASPRTSIYAAIAAAVAASICCLGPLVLVGLGASGAWIGSLSAMEPFRPYLIVAAVGALGYAFWRVYGAKPAVEECGPDGACRVDNAARYNKIGLWLATFAIGAMLLAPNLLGAAAEDDKSAARPSGAGAVAVTVEGGVAEAAVEKPMKKASITLAVENMTCAGCSATVRTALTRVEGVIGASVTHEPPCATVTYDSNEVSANTLTAATEKVGYPTRVAGTPNADGKGASVCVSKTPTKG